MQNKIWMKLCACIFTAHDNVCFRYYDEIGVLFFHDRLKELIKYNNIHVYPNIIEEVIYQHDDVIEAGDIK